jgi:hypothetical protein
VRAAPTYPLDATRSEMPVPRGHQERQYRPVLVGVMVRANHKMKGGVVMADSVRRVEYYYLTLPDMPGEGERVFSVLKEGGVNLLAVLGFPASGGRTQVDLVPEDPVALREAAERSGLTLSAAKQAFLVQGDDRVGAVEATVAKLATAGVNVTAAAAVGDGSGHFGMLVWVAQTEFERAAAALGA